MKQQWAIRFLTICCGLGIAIGLASFWAWGRANQALRDASEQLRECQQLVQEIQQLRQKPVRAAAIPLTPVAVTQSIENAIRGRGIPLSAVLAIKPQPAQRVAQSGFKLQVTRISLDRLTLRQLAEFLKALLDAEPTLTVTSIHLSIPTALSTEADESWHVELTLTHRIFDRTLPPRV